MQCTLVTFFWQLHDTTMGVELYGVSQEELEKKQLETSVRWVALGLVLAPANKYAESRTGFPRGKFNSFNRRSCQHYATELPLRFIARGAEPCEGPPEEGRGHGRHCMAQSCIALSSHEKPTHNLCALRCHALTKSSARSTDDEMRGDYEKAQKTAVSEKQAWYRETLAKLPAVLAYRAPEDWVSPLKDFTTGEAEQLEEELARALEQGEDRTQEGENELQQEGDEEELEEGEDPSADDE